MIECNYITKEEVYKIFEISDYYHKGNHGRIFKKVSEIFNLTIIKKDGSKELLYNKEEILSAKNDVLDFFNKHYTVTEAENKLGVRINKSRFKKIEIPNGYGLIMKVSTGSELASVVYDKSEIDTYCEFKDDINRKIEKGFYISRADAMSLIGISERPFNKIKSKLEEFKFDFKKNGYYYKKEDVEKLKLEYKNEPKEAIVKVVDIPNGFIDKDCTMKLLNIDGTVIKEATVKTILRNIVTGFGIETVKLGSRLYYKEEDVITAINEVAIFCKSHYSIDEVLKELNISTIKIDKVDMPNHYAPIIKYKHPDRQLGKRYIKVTDVEEYKNSRRLNFNEILEVTEEHIASWECLELLNVSKVTFDKMKSEYKIVEIIHKQSKMRYCYRSQILALKKKCEEFYKEYITVKQAVLTYFSGNDNIIYKHSEYLKNYHAPLYAYTKDHTTSLGQTNGNVFKISEVEYLQSNLENIRRDKMLEKENAGIRTSVGNRKSYINYSLEGETYLDTFYLRLYERWSGFKDESSYTKKSWLEFIELKLGAMDADRKVSLNRVNFYVTATRGLENMLKFFEIDEVYELTSNDINTYFNFIETRNLKELLYDYFTRVSRDVEYAAKKRKSNKKGFNIDYIFSPYDEESGSRKLRPYSFDIYSKIFKYTTNKELHIERGIEEILKKGKAKYISVWLYAMLHLNNAWRHGDVSRFPMLNLNHILDEYNIIDFSWFKENEVTQKIITDVLSRITQWEMIISKTKAEGVFFCSDELAPSFITAILILTLYHDKMKTVHNPDKFKYEPLMVFETEYNQPNQYTLDKFFEELTDDDFKFKSLRMNKTVMTLIYYLANLSGDAKGLIYSQKMRGQLDMESPLSYIEINVEHLDSLTRQLFARGEFGFIPSLLISRLNEGKSTLSFEEMTDQVLQVNGLFGELAGLYNTVGFLNNVKHERQLIVDTLAEKSLDQCQRILTDIFAKKLPSRMANIQCLISREDCYLSNIVVDEDEEVSCFDCPYHIPSIYALTTLCESIMNDMKRYKTATRVKQFKLALSIDRKLTLIKEAIAKYGQEYVYNCIGIDRESFLAMVDTIDLPEEFADIMVLEA